MTHARGRERANNGPPGWVDEMRQEGEMRAWSHYELWYGRDESPAEMKELQAGPITALLDGIDLRYVRSGDRELVRRVYVAVRDDNWDTIPISVSNLVINATSDTFAVSFDGFHCQDEIDFRWHGSINGSAEGRIVYRMEGRAGSHFRYSRIGICILHPADSAGMRFVAWSLDGETGDRLPLLIGPQRVVDGHKTGLFPPFTRLAIDLPATGGVSFAFEGELFEMEDQRNWTDGSFKTYSTPLALPLPKHAEPGTALEQSVEMHVRAPAFARPTDASVRLSLGEGIGLQLPPLGLGLADRSGDLSTDEIDLLRSLRLSHLRADLHLADADHVSELQRAARACRDLGCELEAALFVTDDAAGQLAALSPRLADLPLARILVFHEGEKTTGAHWAHLAREQLKPVTEWVPVMGGTNAYFAEINAMRPDVSELDGVVYSLNPQVHAFDDVSLVEALEPQGVTVRSAQAFCPGLPVAVSPVTLKPRFNPNATGPEPAPAADELPPQVDPRQMSLFGAGWTLGSVKYLSEAGVGSVTYFETTGWRGIMETERGSPLPALFPSLPGMVFPMFHVFRGLADFGAAGIVALGSSHPLKVIGLALRSHAGLHLLLANLTWTDQVVSVGQVRADYGAIWRLNDRTARMALREPARFASQTQRLQLDKGDVRLTMSAFEFIRIDIPGGASVPTG